MKDREEGGLVGDGEWKGDADDDEAGAALVLVFVVMAVVVAAVVAVVAWSLVDLRGGDLVVLAVFVLVLVLVLVLVAPVVGLRKSKCVDAATVGDVMLAFA